MKLAAVIARIDRLAPPHLAEAWDNVGLLVGDPSAEVSRAMLCIDYTTAVAAEAQAAGVEFVLAYHPPIFKPLKRLTTDGPAALVYDAIRRGVAIYSPHTALDVAVGGTNDVLADVLGLVDRRPLRASAGSPAEGIGRIGTFAMPTEREALFDRIKHGLAIDELLIAGPASGLAKTAAVCAGSGSELLDHAIAAGVDVYLTGELRHHDALRAAAAGITAVCTLHSRSERVTLGRLVPRLAEAMPSVDWRVSRVDADPFTIRCG